MIYSVARERLIDRTWTASVLADLASFWNALCRRNANAKPGEWHPEWALELRISGFPRSAAPAVRAALAPRAESAPGQTVSAPDPDTFVVSWNPLDRADVQPVGLGLPLLAGPVFEGLVVELRFTLAPDGPLPSTTERGYTLVVLGEMRDSALLVRTLWAGAADVSEFGPRDVPTPWEDALFAGFDRFRGARKIAWRLTDALEFAPPARNAPLDRLLFAPFGRPRWPGLLARCAALALAPVVALLVLDATPANPPWLRVPVAFFVLLWLGALVLFVRGESAVLSSYADTRAENDRQYRRPERYAQLVPEEAAARLDDPHVRKYTADLTERGFVYLGDVTSVPRARATRLYRIFGAPDGITYAIVALDVAYRTEDGEAVIWPALVSFECQTFFSDGGRVDSLNRGSHDTYAPSPTNRLLAFPSATDPLELYRRHTAAVEAFRAEMSATPFRHEPFEVYIRWQNEISANECRGYAERPYSWRAHLRWYLQLDAPGGNG